MLRILFGHRLPIDVGYVRNLDDIAPFPDIVHYEMVRLRKGHPAGAIRCRKFHTEDIASPISPQKAGTGHRDSRFIFGRHIGHNGISRHPGRLQAVDHQQKVFLFSHRSHSAPVFYSSPASTEFDMPFFSLNALMTGRKLTISNGIAAL